jgi:hypothetical protein
MAKLWIAYREGLRLLGAVVGEVALEPSIAALDIAPWRLFSATRPEPTSFERLHATRHHKRALLEVSEQDRYDLCPLSVGLFESPYSPDECVRRLKLDAAPPTVR